jgi:hypothetical protein
MHRMRRAHPSALGLLWRRWWRSKRGAFKMQTLRLITKSVSPSGLGFLWRYPVGCMQRASGGAHRMQAECVCGVHRALAERVYASALTCALYLYQYTPDLVVALPCRVYAGCIEPLQSAYMPARSPIWLWPLSLVSCPSLVYACRSVCVCVCVRARARVCLCVT